MNEELPQRGKLYSANHAGCTHWAPLVPPAVDLLAEAKTVAPAELPKLPDLPPA